MTTATCRTLEVDRAEPGRVQVHEEPVPHPGPGQVVLAVHGVALSANTLTYAALEVVASYWDAFPTAAPWGRVPAWGHGTVVEAAPDAPLAVGTRLYGLLPIASHAVMQPGAAGHGWVADMAPHRNGAGEVYRRYRLLDGADPAEAVDRRAVLAPVVVLSHLLDDLLAEEGLSGAEQVIVTSASSKAALGLAHLLARRGVPAVGLTATARVDAVRAIGAYRQVVAYEAITEDLPRRASVVVDVAGDGGVCHQVGAALGGDAVRVLTVGMARTHADPVGRPPVDLFSAPDRLVALARRDGPAALQQSLDAAVGAVEAWAAGWLELLHADGPQEAVQAYHRVRAGAARPEVGVVVRMAATPDPTTPEAMLALMRSRAIAGSPFTALLHTQLLHCWGGEVELVVPVTDRLTQHHGSLHGGVVATALDNAGCWAAASVMGDVVTSSLTIHYLAPAVGEQLRVRATVATTRGCTGVVHVEAVTEAGDKRTVVATAVVAVRASSA